MACAYEYPLFLDGHAGVMGTWCNLAAAAAGCGGEGGWERVAVALIWCVLWEGRGHVGGM